MARVVRFHQTGGPRLDHAQDFVTRGLEAGQLKPIIAKTFTFDQIVEAHRYLESNQLRDAGARPAPLVAGHALGRGGRILYIIANQLHRQAQFHGGKDLRRKPYAVPHPHRHPAGPAAVTSLFGESVQRPASCRAFAQTGVTI